MLLLDQAFDERFYNLLHRDLIANTKALKRFMSLLVDSAYEYFSFRIHYQYLVKIEMLLVFAEVQQRYLKL